MPGSGISELSHTKCPSENLGKFSSGTVLCCIVMVRIGACVCLIVIHFFLFIFVKSANFGILGVKSNTNWTPSLEEGLTFVDGMLYNTP